MGKSKANSLGAKTWSSIVIFGLVGQIAWVLENMYFNIFMDRTVTRDPVAIWVMVAASAVVATLFTLLAGIFSDKRGRRKKLISIGYIIWGITVMIFAAISVENTMKLFKMEQSKAIGFTVAIIVIMDCVMSALGSTANDAAFNAWITDITDETNRGSTDAVLAIMPLLATGVIFGAFDWMTQDTWRYLDGTEGTAWKEGATLVANGNWVMFFLIIGGLVSLAGVIGLFLVKDSKDLKPNKEISYKDIVYGFKPSVMKENKNLYFAYLAAAISGIANNTFMPYIIIYIERTLGIANYILAIAIVGGLAAVGSVVLGILYDKYGRRKFIIPMFIIYIAGAVLTVFASPISFKNVSTPLWSFAITGFLLMFATLGLSSIIAASIRDWTPVDKVGLFQGVRLSFMVLIPMVIGPIFTVIITRLGTPAGVDQFGEPLYNYPPQMFALAAAVQLVNLPIILKLRKALKENLM